MAAMLQQQYVEQETKPRDWAACGPFHADV